MKKATLILVAFVFSFLSILEARAGSCRSRPSGPDLWGPAVKCPVNIANKFPECDLSIPIHKVSGYLSYWNEFMFANKKGPCDIVPKHFPAYLDHQSDLESCVDYICTEEAGKEKECTADVLIWPYFVKTQRTTEVISGQESCERRHFVAKGCFVKGSKGKVFVANMIDFHP